MSNQSTVTNQPIRQPRITLLRSMIAIVIIVTIGAAYFLLTRNRPVPQVTFTTLTGEKITSQSLRGKVVMVNFWATNCAPCIHAMPTMVSTYNQYNAQGLEMVAVAMSYDAPNYVIHYAQTRQLPFKVAFDARGELAKAFGDVQTTPTTFIIDRNGDIIKRFRGEPEIAELHEVLDNALKI